MVGLCHSKQKLATYNQSSLRPPDMWVDQGDTLTDIFLSADETLFRKVFNNPFHVPFAFPLSTKKLTYNLRPRAHKFIFPMSSIAASKTCAQRVLFKDVY